MKNRTWREEQDHKQLVREAVEIFGTIAFMILCLLLLIIFPGCGTDHGSRQAYSWEVSYPADQSAVQAKAWQTCGGVILCYGPHQASHRVSTTEAFNGHATVSTIECFQQETGSVDGVRIIAQAQCN